MRKPRRGRRKRFFNLKTIFGIFVIAVVLISCILSPELSKTNTDDKNKLNPVVTIGNLELNDNLSDKLTYVVLNKNTPTFTNAEKTTNHYIKLSPLDKLGRTGVSEGSFSYASMPTSSRESLATKPTGWIQHRYETSVVEGGWIYNRSHQLGYQISGLQDVKENLFTGTRSCNTPNMLQFENMVADHMRDEKTHHIMYRVTPVFGANNLLSYGVMMMSDCIECDDSDFNVFVYNTQKGIKLNYKTGENSLK